MAGRDVGRIRRFLPEGMDATSLRKKREREARRLSTLALLLQDDPEYAALYNDTLDRLRAAEAATERALAEAVERNDQAAIDAIRLYQVDVLGSARDRLSDEDDPLSKDELKDLQRDIVENLPEAMKSYKPTENPGANSVPQSSVSVEIPKL